MPHKAPKWFPAWWATCTRGVLLSSVNGLRVLSLLAQWSKLPRSVDTGNCSPRACGPWCLPQGRMLLLQTELRAAGNHRPIPWAVEQEAVPHDFLSRCQHTDVWTFLSQPLLFPEMSNVKKALWLTESCLTNTRVCLCGHLSHCCRITQ